MSDTVTLKRIVALDEQTEVSSSDYTIIDNGDGSAKKYPIGDFVNSVAPEFDATTAYSAGDIVLYGGKLYQFTANHAAGAWSGSDAETVTVGEELSSLKGDLNEILVDNSTGSAATLTNQENAQSFYTKPYDGSGIVKDSYSSGVAKFRSKSATEKNPYILFATGLGNGKWMTGAKVKFTKLDPDLGNPTDFRFIFGDSSGHTFDTIDYPVVWDEWFNIYDVFEGNLQRFRLSARGFSENIGDNQFSLELKDVYIYSVSGLSNDLINYIKTQQQTNYQDGTVTYSNVVEDLGPDKSLTHTGKAADAKAAGDAINKINTETYNVKAFGVNGDGTTDDTDAINALFASGSGRYYFPAGTYKISGTIEIGENSEVFGDGDDTIFDMYNCVDLTACTFRGNDKVYPYIFTQSDNVTIRKIKLIGNNTLHEQRHAGIAILDAEKCTVEDVTIYNINYDPEQDLNGTVSGYGICVNRSEYVNVERCYSERCGYECIGIVDNCNFCTVKDCYTKDGWRTCIQVHRGSCNTLVENCYMKQTHTKYDACFTVHGLADSDLVKNLHVINCVMECTQDGAQPYVYNAPAQIMSYSDGLVFIGNRIIGGKRAFYIAESSNNAKIIGNDFQCNDQSDYGVVIGSLNTIVVANCLTNEASTPVNTISNNPVLSANIGIS